MLVLSYVCICIQKQERWFVHSIGEVLNYVETSGYGWWADLIPNTIKEVESTECLRQDESNSSAFSLC